jgi:hypothetical protein
MKNKFETPMSFPIIQGTTVYDSNSVKLYNETISDSFQLFGPDLCRYFLSAFQ